MSTDRTPYLPSNATEFDIFYGRNCKHCTQDDPENEIGCPIIGEAIMENSVTGHEGPSQWITDPVRGPLCTAYTENAADPTPCPDTKELFS